MILNSTFNDSGLNTAPSLRKSQLSWLVELCGYFGRLQGPMAAAVGKADSDSSCVRAELTCLGIEERRYEQLLLLSIQRCCYISASRNLSDEPPRGTFPVSVLHESEWPQRPPLKPSSPLPSLLWSVLQVTPPNLGTRVPTPLSQTTVVTADSPSNTMSSFQMVYASFSPCYSYQRGSDQHHSYTARSNQAASGIPHAP